MFKCTGNCAECGRCTNYITDNRKFQGVTSGIYRKFTKNPITSKQNCYGMAVDIGTTTIAGYLYKFPECELVSSICVPNSQVIHGADVISRIEYANNGGLDNLRDKVWAQIDKITAAFESKAGEAIDTFVITGNTAMLHILEGIDPRSLAVAPFTPQSLFGQASLHQSRVVDAQTSARETREVAGKTYLPRCISSYVGADITCGILASGMMEDKVSFLVDIGTNGEMALWSGEKLVCCATAAGPAFEGAGIAAGCPAVSGAINKVCVSNGEISYTTIDDETPMGICGTGIIDVIACMLALGVIDETGYLEDDFQIGDSGIFITPNDIRQVQLAKSAIRAGIDTLLNERGVTVDDVENFYIAGGFGNYIDKQSCAKIGLIPSEILDKVVVIGNSAGIGAGMILQSRACLEESERIGEMAETVDLSTSSYFMEKYVEHMMF
ncbi:MAG: ASKHA domain-containing protein [Oscillospiraceae bacterium]|nr:ASKHA domain-containing protein [Oscillospiraceae bacterium]